LCYAVDPRPGHPLGAHDEFSLPRVREDSEKGRAHFAAVILTIEDMDLLWLGAAGNRRASYRFASNKIEARWMVP
ncbi:MAG: hypothetical protein ACKOBC_03290, partial [Hyphomicrobiales bacterium]